MALLTPAVYRQRLYQTVLLPSGGEARIRKCSVSIFFGLGELPIPHVATPDDPTQAPQPPTVEEMLKIQRFTDRALAEGAVAPAITDALDAEGKPVYRDDALHVREVELDDYVALSKAIFALMGLTEEAGQAAQSFRDDPLREAPPSPGAGVSRPAPYAPEPDPLGTLFRPAGDLATPGPGDGPQDDETTRHG